MEAQMAPKKEYETEPSRESVVPTAAEVAEQTEHLMGSIGQTMNSAAQTTRRTKKSAGAAMETIAEGIETSTEYLTDRGMVGVTKDVEGLIRRYPFQALMLGVSVGYLLSRSRH